MRCVWSAFVSVLRAVLRACECVHIMRLRVLQKCFKVESRLRKCVESIC